jgi:O-antigen/teichoic acid export membrane protein
MRQASDTGARRVPSEAKGNPRLAVNFTILSSGECLSKLFALIAFAYLARALGPREFGHLELTLAIIIFFTLLVDCGLSPYGAREIAKDNGAVAHLAVHIVLVRGLLAVGAFTLLAILVAVIDKPWPLKQLILLYGLTLFGQPGLLHWVFQGLDRMQYVSMASVTRWSMFALGVVLFVREPSRIWLIPVIEGVAVGCVVIFYVCAVSHVYTPLRRRIDPTFALSTLRRALPIGASELVWAVKIYAATVLLGATAGGSEVGWFSAAHRLVISAHTFVWLYFFNLLPSLARCSQGSLVALHSLMRRSIQVSACVALFLGVVATAFAEPVIALVYGPQYHQAVAVLRVLIWLIPLALISGHYHYTLVAYDKQQLQFLSMACGAGANVLLNLVLIPTYGGAGAAWALIASEALAWGVAYYFVRRTIAHIPAWRHVYRPLLAGAALAGILYLLPPLNLWMAGGSAIVVYGLILSIVQPRMLSEVRSVLISKGFARPDGY